MAGGRGRKKQKRTHTQKNGDGGGVSSLPMPSARARDLESAWGWWARTQLRGEAWRARSPASRAAMTAAGRITAGSATAARQQQAATRQLRASAREKAGSGERAPCEGKESRSRGGWMALVYEIHGNDACLPSAVSRGFLPPRCAGRRRFLYFFLPFFHKQGVTSANINK